MSDDSKVRPAKESAIWRWLNVRRNFIRLNTLLMGCALFVIASFSLHEAGIKFGILWTLFVPVAFGGGYLWALAMWQWHLGWRTSWNRDNDT